MVNLAVWKTQIQNALRATLISGGGTQQGAYYVDHEPGEGNGNMYLIRVQYAPPGGDWKVVMIIGLPRHSITSDTSSTILAQAFLSSDYRLNSWVAGELYCAVIHDLVGRTIVPNFLQIALIHKKWHLKQAVKEREEKELQLQKSERAELKKAPQLYKLKIAQEKRVARAEAKVVREKEKAEQAANRAQKQKAQ
ncbi:hypothetical protein GQ43DRAFT_471665 [Delitschia confertaspora ATCC 74209]|uniref:Uncharacterized protein n=1 Tax=Delitschia confertaspora ATCC 74209 TaxID=1513339 RepID=A0A9P4JQT9_9PLEO|nr:hypothetical protein GQ43DRAFT_471665 [Delitschia confertaspora ATCC 74209]